MFYKLTDETVKPFIVNIQEYFERKENTTLFKKRNVVKVILYQNQEYVVKSFKIPHLLNQIVYRFFRDSKAKRSYENSLKLVQLGISTPQPIAYIESPSWFLFKESFYISDFFNYDFEIRAVFKDENFKDRENILKKFIEFSYHLHNQGVYHIDYSPGNILVKNIEGAYTFSIIDVNRMKFLEFDDDLRMKSLVKLTNNSNDNEYMVKLYAEVSNKNSQHLLEKMNHHLKEQQKYLNNKKRLKKIKG